MIQIIEENRPKSTADRFGQAFGNLGQAAGKLIPEHFVKKEQQKNNENAIEKLIGKNISGLSPELVKDYVSEALKGQREEKLFEQRAAHEKEQAATRSQHEREMQREKYGFEEETEKRKPKKLTPFEEAYQKKQVEVLTKAKDQLATQEAGLEDIGWLESKAKEVRELGTMFGSLTGFGSLGKEFDTTAHTILEPILKIFNPTGALPTSKIEMLKKVYVPLSSETQGTIEGKLRAARRLYERGIQLNRNKIAFIESRGGQISNDDEQMIDDAIQKELDAQAAQDASTFGTPYSKVTGPSPEDFSL